VAVSLGPTLADCEFPLTPVAQDVGISLTGLGKGDDLVRDGLFYVVVSGVQGDANHFERDAQNALGLWVEPDAVQVGGDGQGGAPDLRR
jgi:hypothetical protein